MKFESNSNSIGELDVAQQIEQRIDTHIEHLCSIKSTLQNGEAINKDFEKFLTEATQTFWDLPTPRTS